MAGLYIHIPFCKQACVYCNFHFSTNTKYKDKMIRAMASEIKIRKDYLHNQTINSIYFGGGTPSILDQTELNILFDAIYKQFKVAGDAEITLESNPDDLHDRYVSMLASTPINRLSIGIQSFFDDELKWMNRAHQASQSIAAVKRAQDAGFQNITIDLIYGIPVSNSGKWEQNILKALQLNVDHISAYCLTVEEKTQLGNLIAKDATNEPDDEISQLQFNMLIDKLEEAGYQQYEISNFARNKKYAIHNSSYWKQHPYLGIGPSAHSFDIETRCWNVNNNHHYIEKLETGNTAFETEVLSPENRFNEYIMTSLRTMWGCDKNILETDYKQQLQKIKIPLENQIKVRNLIDTGTHYKLAKHARFFADGIAASLFV